MYFSRRVSRKAKSSRSLKGADMLVRLLPLACAFESCDLKAHLLLGYLLTTRLRCDNKGLFLRCHFPICTFLRFGIAG